MGVEALGGRMPSTMHPIRRFTVGILHRIWILPPLINVSTIRALNMTSIMHFNGWGHDPS